MKKEYPEEGFLWPFDRPLVAEPPETSSWLLLLPLRRRWELMRRKDGMLVSRKDDLRGVGGPLSLPTEMASAWRGTKDELEHHVARELGQSGASRIIVSPYIPTHHHTTSHLADNVVDGTHSRIPCPPEIESGCVGEGKK